MTSELSVKTIEQKISKNFKKQRDKIGGKTNSVLKKYKQQLKYLEIGIILLVSFFAIRLELREIKMDELRKAVASLSS